MLKLFKLWFDNMNLLINQNIKARCACVSLYVGKGDNIECRRMTKKNSHWYCLIRKGRKISLACT